jgi:cytochrome c peroxidase
LKNVALVLLAAVAVCAAGQARAQAAGEWSPSELKILRSLTLSSLPKLPPDPSNKYADDPNAADFGHRLFFDTRLSSNGGVGCVTCHRPALNFTDGLKVSVGVGVTDRNAPTVVGAAYNTWFFWDGRKDSQWSQALGSIENPREQNMPRDRYIETIRVNPDLAQDYTALFGPLPAAGDRDGINRAFSNIGKAIAAYERRIMPGPAKFDRYVDAILAGRKPALQDQLTLDESQGLHVFISEQLGRCVRCHNGPLFTDGQFHNIAVFGPAPATGDEGRAAGVEAAIADEFNCKSRYSDARPDDCTALKSARPHEPALLGAFKTPTLRNLSKTAPYMHIGSRRSLNDVMWHYRTLPTARVGKIELDSFTITGAEFDQLEAFLRTLDGTIDAPAKYLRPPAPLARKQE